MKYNSQDIIIKKKDVMPYVYFVCSMAQHKMYSGLSGDKSDLMGGIFDRWINIIPESIIFNKHFLPKIADDLTVVSDYYVYDPKKAGIAPDVLGVKIGAKVIPFVEYVNSWNIINDAPEIEVKTFKSAQYMVSLRNQHYDNKYLVMVETNLDSDYLLPFFEEAVIEDSIYGRLEMDDSLFIKKDDEGLLSHVTKVECADTDLGTLRLIIVCSASDFMKYSTECGPGEGPIYVKAISETRVPKQMPETYAFSELVSKNDDTGLYDWKKNILDDNPRHKLLSIFVDKIENIQVIKNSKSSITIFVNDNTKINDTLLEAGKVYIIKFQTLDRSSKKNSEYFMHKSIIDMVPDKESLMLDGIRNVVDKQR